MPTAANITRIEHGQLEGHRPRNAGSNARLGEHGSAVHVPIIRLTTDDGASGFGRGRITPEQASVALGRPLSELFDPAHGATSSGLPFDFALWDLAGQRAGKPAYALAAEAAGRAADAPLRVPCYDTSLYIDDLHLADDDAAAELIAAEARAGLARDHRAFKIKIGRGARHMPLERGMQRDIAVIRAVRAAVGPDAKVMLDANNGYNLNLTKRVLAEVAECNIHWIEEAFHEDPVLYQDLQTWLMANGSKTLIADGEGQASPTLLDWARDGLINVVQYDIFSYGFTPWLALGRQLNAWGARSAPHHYGGHYGNYASGHLAAAIHGFAMVEWDEVTTAGLDASSYAVHDGYVTLPDALGFGLTLDEGLFQSAIAANGFVHTLR
jgi:L-alanine-DL-glutamate epimerase-like enolase superfamily enzyme